MSRIFKHIVLPSVATVVVLGLYFTPVSLLGCSTCGLLALAVVGVSLLAALATCGIALSKRIKGGADSAWWIVSTVILLVPALLVFGPLR